MKTQGHVGDEAKFRGKVGLTVNRQLMYNGRKATIKATIFMLVSKEKKRTDGYVFFVFLYPARTYSCFVAG